MIFPTFGKRCGVFTFLALWLGMSVGAAAQTDVRKNVPSLQIRNPEVLQGSKSAVVRSDVRPGNWLSLSEPDPIKLRSAEILPCWNEQARCGYLGTAWDIWKVRVRLDVSGGPREYQVSEIYHDANAPWYPFTNEFVYTLSPGLGEKTLHVRLRGKPAPRINNRLLPGAAVAPQEREETPAVTAAGSNRSGGLVAVEVDSEQLRADALGVQYAELTTTYRVNGTIRIVSLGESYAAGEGAPDVATGNARTTRWQSQQCHRSAKNGRALAVAGLQQAFGDDVTIVYRDFACSGASINEGLLGPFRGLPGFDGEIRDSLPAQVEQASAWLAGNRPDIVLLSVGGNDVGFAEAITKCISPAVASTRESLASASINWPWGCGEDPELRELVRNGDPANPRAKIGFANLPAAYAMLDREIEQALNPRHVLITEYPDPTRDEFGKTCGCIYGSFKAAVRAVSGHRDGTWAAGCYNEDFAVRPEDMSDPYSPLKSVPAFAGFALGASSTHLWDVETAWIRENILETLNTQILRAARLHGWRYVGGIAQATRLHGLCASPGERWFNTLRDSWESQGDIYGAVHPNEAGHRAYRDAILRSLEEVLRD